MRNFIYGILISVCLFAGYMVYVGNVDLEFKFGYTTANNRLAAQIEDLSSN